MIKLLFRIAMLNFMSIAIVASGTVAAQQCYYDKSVGCDPEGYGYDEVSCPTNCRDEDFNNIYGCTDDNGTVEYYSIKHAFFDSLIMRLPGQDLSVNPATSFLEDVTKEWKFNVCLKEGTCSCEPILHPSGLIGRFCKKNEEYVWEEAYPQLTQTVCDFQLADDPCECYGDPECEYYCYYDPGDGY